MMLSNAAKLFLIMVSFIAIIYPILFTVQFYFLVKRVERIEDKKEEEQHERVHNKGI